MPTLKMRKSVRVVLKNNKSADGKIVEAAGTHSWNVLWSTGPHAGQDTKQSSVSLTFWSALDVPISSDDEGGVDYDRSPSDTEDAAHALKKTRFESHRKLLEGKVVVVRLCR